MATITIPCALAGIISGVLSVTGVGVRMSTYLLDMSGGNLVILLILVGIVTFVMGMGLPSLLCYIIQLPVTIPAMIAMGMPKIGAHLFVVYIATLAFITPPVGMSIYASAGLANASFMKVGYRAFQVGAVAFMVPFIFAFTPSVLLLEFNFGVIYDVIMCIAACVLMSISVEGWLFEKVAGWIRIVLFVCSIGMFHPNRIITAAGVAVAAALFIYLRVTYKKRLDSGTAVPAEPSSTSEDG